MNLDTSFPSIFTLHSSFFIVFRIVLLVSLSLLELEPYLRHMAELWTVEQGARPVQN